MRSTRNLISQENVQTSNRLQGWYYCTTLSVLVMLVFGSAFYLVSALQSFVCLIIRKGAIHNFTNSLFNLFKRNKAKVFVKGSMYLINPSVSLGVKKAIALMSVLRSEQRSRGENGGWTAAITCFPGIISVFLRYYAANGEFWKHNTKFSRFAICPYSPFLVNFGLVFILECIAILQKSFLELSFQFNTTRWRLQ